MSDTSSSRVRKGTKKDTAYENRPKRKRPLNRHEIEKPEDLNVSASARKLKEKDSNDIEVDPTFGYHLVNFVTVFDAISNVMVCKECHSNVRFTESSKRGLGFKIVISCDNCDKKEIPNSPFIKNAYEINRRIILAMRLLGIGVQGIRKFCAFMELPRPVFQSVYDTIIENILAASDVVSKNSMSNAANDEKRISNEKGEKNGITVSGDGSWRKRGFSSLYGLVSLIGWYTGKLVDVLVKSKYCKACEYWQKKYDTDEYKEWAENHAAECQANHDGSAGKMEVDAAIEMFQRSEDLHDVKYVSYIGDGDSKTFKGITDAQPYENITITKKECIDHVQKRIGTHLRNLKKNTKGLGGKGKLTGKLIDELSIYFGLAIRRNCHSIEKMKNAIWGTLFHKMSTDENPQHDHCPTGENSWCSWQRAKCENALAGYTHKPPMREEVFEAIKPVYEKLVTDDLLTRCIGGYTQNNNESFNATVWAMVPKGLNSGKKIIDIGTNIATSVFNDGLMSVLHVIEVMGMKIGTNSFNLCVEVDEKRIKKAEKSISDGAKQARLDLKSMRKEKEELEVDLEGQLYGAGIAD